MITIAGHGALATSLFACSEVISIRFRRLKNWARSKWIVLVRLLILNQVGPNQTLTELTTRVIYHLFNDNFLICFTFMHEERWSVILLFIDNFIPCATFLSWLLSWSLCLGSLYYGRVLWGSHALMLHQSWDAGHFLTCAHLRIRRWTPEIADTILCYNSAGRWWLRM